jgi:hypothetical protein
VSENRALRRVFRPKKEAVEGCWSSCIMRSFAGYSWDEQIKKDAKGRTYESERRSKVYKCNISQKT